MLRLQLLWKTWVCTWKMTVVKEQSSRTFKNKRVCARQSTGTVRPLFYLWILKGMLQRSVHANRSKAFETSYCTRKLTYIKEQNSRKLFKHVFVQDRRQEQSAR